MKTPCYGCDKRSAECHSTCEQYKEFRAWKESQYEERKIKYIVSDTLNRPRRERADRMRKKGKRK